MVKVRKKYVKISSSENPSNLKRQLTMASQTGSLSLVMFYLRKRYAAMTSTPSFFIIHHQTHAFWLFLNLIYRTMRRCLLNQKPWADQREKVIKQLRLVDMVIKQLNRRTSGVCTNDFCSLHGLRGVDFVIFCSIWLCRSCLSKTSP